MSDAPVVYVDASVLIVAVEQLTDEAKWLMSLLTGPALPKARFVTSTLTLTECLAGALKKDDAALLSAYARWFTPTSDLQILDLQDVEFRVAAALRADHQALRTPDAIHIASAMLNGCDGLLTGDKRLRADYALTPDQRVGIDEPAAITILNVHTHRAAIDTLITGTP